MHVIWNITKQWQAPASQMPGLAKCASASPCTSTRASFVGSHATMEKTDSYFSFLFQRLILITFGYFCNDFTINV